MILTLDTIYKDVLEGIANRDENQHYPPHVRDQHINYATNALIDECVKLYPTNNSVIGILKPFIKQAVIRVENGEVKFPKDYRNYFGMAVYVRDEAIGSKSVIPCLKDGSTICEAETKGDKPTEQQMKEKALKRTCRSNPVAQKSLGEWDIATGHSYKKPTLENPMCCIFDGEGITINPYNVEEVVLRYVKIPLVYKYGYTLLPDGTTQWNPNDTIESEWETPARQYLNKAMNTLYSIYARDGEMREGNLEIKKISFF